MIIRSIFKPGRTALRWSLLLAVAAMHHVAAAAGSGPADSDPTPVPAGFLYRIESHEGVSIQPRDDRCLVKGSDGFRLRLVPAAGEFWNMEQVSVLGLVLKNNGETELVLDLMLGNDGATGWSRSALGRTIVGAGEELPLSVALCRSADYAGTDPAYLRMSGRPDGRFRHWHTIDPVRVKNLVITCSGVGDHAFELGPMFPLREMDDRLTGVFPFIDEYGQYMFKTWPGKVASDADLRRAIAAEKLLEENLGEPTGFTKYGGWAAGAKFEATGRFRTAKHEGRWWFIDPEGCLFWSYGMDCVGVEFAGQTPLERDQSVFQKLPSKEDKAFGPFYTKLDLEDNYRMREDIPHYDFTRANLYRKYGCDWAEESVAQDIKRMKYCNLNTIGAWSDSDICARREVPYTVMLHYEYGFAAEKLPDPFDPETRAGLRKAIHEYPVDFKDDPWCLGAFVDNELHWENDARRMVAAILGYEEMGTEARKVFRKWLGEKYPTIEAFNTAWKTNFQSLEELLTTTDESLFRHADAADCSALATLFAEAFFKMVREELEAFSPGILYLGSRMNSGSDEVIRAAAKYADVISANIYGYRPNPGKFGSTDKPVLITEFHFANISGNNLGSGLRSAGDAVQQGRLFRAFMVEAVDHPQVIGAHWYQWRDQNVGGRYDGENYNIGFFDIADMPHPELVRTASEFGRNLYESVK